MNQNIELALLTKVVDERDLHTLERAKIDETYFFSPEAQETYRWLRDIYHAPSTAGDVPSRELLRSYFPSFQFFNSTDSIHILVEQLRREKISVEVQLHAQDIMVRVAADPLDALAAIQARSPSLTALAARSEDYDMSAVASMVEQRYNTVQNAQGVIGIPYPWDCMNQATQGMRPQNFIVIYGRPKSMKTWFALKLAVFAYIFARRRVLFYSREMSPEELMGRVACLITGVDYEDFLNARLQPAVKERLLQNLRELADDEQMEGRNRGGRNPRFIITSDREAEGAGGVSWLQAKIEETDPDIAFVDGMYLMKDDRTKSRTIDWKNITHISQDLKGTARAFQIPVVGITQARRGAEKTHGEDLTEIAYADALGQDADAVYRVKKQVKLDPQTKRRVIELLIMAPGLREGIFDGMILDVWPAYRFELKKVLTALDNIEGHDRYDEASSEPSGPARLRAPSPFTRAGILRDPKIPMR